MTEFRIMLENLQDITQVSQKELSVGICSRSTLSRAFTGKGDLKGIYFYYIMKRLFVSPDRFFTLISQTEYDYFMWLHTCQELVTEKAYVGLADYLKDDHPLDRFSEFKKIVQRDVAFFEYIVEREVRKDDEAALKKIKKTIDFMRAEDDVKPLIPGRYSTEELNRFMNYLDLMLNMQLMPPSIAKSIFDQIHKMAAFSQRDPREEARIYPRIACFTLKTLGEEYTPEAWYGLINESLVSLRKTSDCFDLPALLELLCEAADFTNDPETPRYKSWYKAICQAYQISEYPTAFNRYDAHDNHNQLYLIHEYLKRNRQWKKDSLGKEYNQFDISNEVMDASHYSRIETGSARPRRKHFERLAQNIGVSGKMYQGDIITAYLSDFYLLGVIRHAINTGDAETIKEGLAVLEDHLDKIEATNAQLIEQLRTSLDLMEGNITGEEAISRWEKALNLTLDIAPSKKHVFSDMEIELSYQIIREKRLQGIMTAEDIDVLKTILVSDEEVTLSSWERTGLTRRLYAGILQTSGNAKEGEKEAKRCLYEMCAAQNAHVMVDCLDILAESIFEKDKNIAENMIQAAYWISDLYQKQTNMEAMTRLSRRLFNNEIKNL